MLGALTALRGILSLEIWLANSIAGTFYSEVTMQRTMLQVKIQNATVTKSNPVEQESCAFDEEFFPCRGESSPAAHPEGSCAIDEALLEAADIREHQQIHVYNADTGDRFTTCAIPAKRGSGTICMNETPAARAAVGALLTITAYGNYSDVELVKHQPRLICVDERNRLTSLAGTVASR